MQNKTDHPISIRTSLAVEPEKRSKVPRQKIDGVLLLDKPVGWSSNDALIKAKRLLLAAKGGHTGTLDPFATGLLPLCFGEATKFSQDLLEADKTYDTTVHLGVRTTTGDTEGEVLATLPVDVTLEQIHAVLARFRGPIQQVPPMHSALKRDGKPLYEYARAGITLERDARAVTIHQLDLLEYDAPFLKLRVCCSKGTYIRVLGEDIGTMLGCGAHLQALRRVQVGELVLGADVMTLEALEAVPQEARAALLAPPDRLLSSFPAVSLPADLAQRFLHGQRISLGKHGLALPVLASGQTRVRVYGDPSQLALSAAGGVECLLGTANMRDDGSLAPERLVVTAANAPPT